MPRTRSTAVEGIDASVGRRLRGRRLELGLSQTQLADALGVTFQQVQKYENGTNRIGPSRLVMAAAVLRVPPHSFFETPTPQGVNLSKESLEEIHEFLSNKDALALAAAFVRIKARAVRRDITNLVSEIARTLEANAL
jgi:transcriptional regulator with XRE-family HTH domain